MRDNDLPMLAERECFIELSAIALMDEGAKGAPLAPTQPSDANSAAISRYVRRPPLGDLRNASGPDWFQHSFCKFGAVYVRSRPAPHIARRNAAWRLLECHAHWSGSMLTRAEFSNAVVTGIQKGNRLSALWSGDRTIQDQGAEYLLTVEVARALYRAQIRKDATGYVSLETSPREILERMPRRPGRLALALRATGRIDVVLYNKEQIPVAVVEVKRYLSDVEKDVNRIVEILRRSGRGVGGPIRFGAIAVISVREERKADKFSKRVKTYCDRWENKVQGLKASVTVPSKLKLDLHKSGTWYAFAVCVILSLKS